MRRWVSCTVLCFAILTSPLAHADDLRCFVWNRITGKTVGFGLLTVQEQEMVAEIEDLFRRVYKNTSGTGEGPRHTYEEPETISTALSFARHERDIAYLKRQWEALAPDLRRHYAKLMYDQVWRDTVFLDSHRRNILSNTTDRFSRLTKFHDYRVTFGMVILEALVLLRRMDRLQQEPGNHEAVLTDLRKKFEEVRERLVKVHFEFYNLSLAAINADVMVSRLTLVQQRAIVWDWLAQVYPSQGWRDWRTYVYPHKHWRTFVNPIRRWAFITYVLVWKTQYYRWANASFFSKFITPVLVTMATPLIISSFQMIAGGKFDNSLIGIILEALRHMFSSP